MLIFENCHRFIWELERYRWDDYTGKSKDKKDKKQKPIDKDDHFIENAGRFLIENLSFIEMQDEIDYIEDDIPFDPY